MKSKIKFNLNFGYDSKSDVFSIDGSLSIEGDLDSEELNRVGYDDNQYIEYDDSDE